MTSTLRDPDQLEAALDHVFRLLILAVESPGAIRMEELGLWLRAAATERDRQGDYGAAEMLDALAVQAEGDE